MGKDELRDHRKNTIKKSGLSPGNFNSLPNNKKYNSTPSDRFYTEKEEVTLRFYQVPKALFKNPKYKDLSLGPKLMYSILRDRLDLSIKNNWKDENGFIYLVFSIEELSTLLEINKETVTTYKRKLVRYKLIIDKRLGQGKFNIIYVLKPEIKEFLNTENPYSRVRKNKLPGYGKSDPNDTNINETNLNNVNNTDIKEVVENFGKGINEKTAENEEDVNDIRRIIKESLKENRKCKLMEQKNSGKVKKPLESHPSFEGKYFNKSMVEKYPVSGKYRSKEKELLAKEIAEELNDNHSLGAFRAVAYKIPEQKIRIFFYLTIRVFNNLFTTSAINVI
ncbi:MAG: replication initiator protein A [candidate division Zixibacteria bacterium]|nr:replication initiator protein A [candidate division Zixibacteria bacterium]